MSTPNTVVSPQIQSRPQVRGNQASVTGAPFAKVLNQDNTPWTGSWFSVPEGGILSATLTLASVVGSVVVYVETCEVGDGSRPPRVLGVFRQALVAGAAVVKQIFAPCDAYMRISATPGFGGGQNANWQVTGKIIVPFVPGI